MERNLMDLPKGSSGFVLFRFVCGPRFRALGVHPPPRCSLLSETSCRQHPVYTASGRAKRLHEKSWAYLLSWRKQMAAKAKPQNSVAEQRANLHLLCAAKD